MRRYLGLLLILCSFALTVGAFQPFWTRNTPTPTPTPTATPTPTPGLAPTVVTFAATNITSTGATLNGQVNPNGTATQWRFNYGTTTSYGTNTSLTNAGSGIIPVGVTTNITGLSSGVMYHYRVTATSSVGTTNGLDITFTTGAPTPTPTPTPTPIVATSPATLISDTVATLNGQVNPKGSETTYQFNWGTTTSYGTNTTSTSAGSGVNLLPESAAITGLTPSATYHYRITATNPGGTVNGSDVSFVTTGTPTPTPSPTPIVINPYAKGAWGLWGTGANLDAALNANKGLVGVDISEDWKDIETADGTYEWGVIDNKVNQAIAAGLHVNIGVLASSTATPDWMYDDPNHPMVYIYLLDPGHDTGGANSTYGDPIRTPLYWDPRWHAKRKELIKVVAAHFASLSSLVDATVISFANHRTFDWNTLDSRATLTNVPANNCPPSIPGTYVAYRMLTDGSGKCDIDVDEPLQWIKAGWTRAKMVTVAEEIADTAAEVWLHENFKLPIGGDDIALGDAPMYQPKVNLLTVGSPLITTADLTTTNPLTNFSAYFTQADVGGRISGTGIPASTTILSVQDSTHATLDKNITIAANNVTATFADRNPDIRYSPPQKGNYSSRVSDVLRMLALKPYYDRILISRNTAAASWNVAPPAAEPGPEGEQYIKWLIATWPKAGLQTVTSAWMCANFSDSNFPNGREDCGAPCRVYGQNRLVGNDTNVPPTKCSGNTTPITRVDVMQLVMNVMDTPKANQGYGAWFLEMWFQDANNPLNYAMTIASTCQMGGTPRAPATCP